MASPAVAPSPQTSIRQPVAPTIEAAAIQPPTGYRTIGGLHVKSVLADVVEQVLCPDTGVSPEYFWASLGHAVRELAPGLSACLTRRDELQKRIDDFYLSQRRAGVDPAAPEQLAAAYDFLRGIGYLVPDAGNVSVTTANVDPELASVAAPQLVVPSDNARYALNAVNARWTSLFDALYGFDVIAETAMTKGPTHKHPDGSYNESRGDAVVEFANHLLDETFPLEVGHWAEVTRLWPRVVGDKQQLQLQLKSGVSTGLKNPSAFAGSTGSMGPPTSSESSSAVLETRRGMPQIPDQGRIFLRHHGLHMILEIDRAHPVGKRSLSGIMDVTMESALTAILDMEDSVAAVDAEDKARVYTNIAGVFRGNLSAPMVKRGKAIERRMASDIVYRDCRGQVAQLPGRVVVLVRNVGHHMFTDAVLTKDGKEIPEGFLDCAATVVSALADLRGNGKFFNSRTGSVYIVKPKQHGPNEVALTSRLFGIMEELFGLQRNTIKMGIMDEERRTTVNLKECIRAASERVVFINTGFLDRTGDEIHTCMQGGPVVRKADMKKEAWIRAYEDANVDVGLRAGLHGRGQIGKGMWPKPDSMAAMLDAKISELMAGASTAWVPSPAAATLHAIHYHRVDVMARQPQLAMRTPAKVETILQPPFLKAPLGSEEVNHELMENAQSILGYVVRWVNLGIGCSKVPDLSNVGLMEDRATLRISSQLLANWLEHGVITESQLRETFEKMARVVDSQNANDRSYQPMAPDFDSSVAYQAALRLVMDGKKSPNGYTEPILHEARRQVKARLQSRL